VGVVGDGQTTYIKGADGWRIARSKLSRLHTDVVVPTAD
jgi:hypothetical protein